MDLDTRVKLAVYRRFAETGRAPGAGEVAQELGTTRQEVTASYGALREGRVLFLEPDGETIRMAPPFSGVPTPHVVAAAGVAYFANCAWDALGIPAALQRPATVRSACGWTGEPLRLEVGTDGPEPSPWVFHSMVPAAHWWRDLVLT